VHIRGSNVLNLNSGLGQFAVGLGPPRPQTPNWRFISQPAAPIAAQLQKMKVVAPLLKVSRGPVESFVFMRFWIPVIATGALAVLSWVHWRFSLRTLLLATTLVAAVLGLAVAFR
jgi:hypothetical protein